MIRIYEQIEPELRNNPSVVYSSVPYLLDEMTSTYGDPEIALIRNEECAQEERVDPYSRHRQEILTCIQMMHPFDRYLLAVENFKTQTEIAEIFSLSQPSISARYNHAHTWLRLVVPWRIFASGWELPGYYSKLAQTVFQRVIWEHRTQTSVARELGRSQGCIRHHLLRTIATLGEIGEHPHPLRLMGEAAAVNLATWAAPRVRPDTAQLLPPSLRCPDMEYQPAWQYVAPERSNNRRHYSPRSSKG